MFLISLISILKYLLLPLVSVIFKNVNIFIVSLKSFLDIFNSLAEISSNIMQNLAEAHAQKKKPVTKNEVKDDIAFN